MNVGTKSILFGSHQFLLHPIFVFVAWWKLYGFPRDPRLWVAFVVHDWGYWGKPNMDGKEGEQHVWAGAYIMHWLFDWPRIIREKGRPTTPNWRWLHFTAFHSRYIAKQVGQPHSRLCVADKLATVLYPTWLYLLLGNFSGEIHEYMDKAHHREGGKYAHEIRILDGQHEWFESMKDYMRRWINEHKDLKPDNWTPTKTN